jgi:polysaccharide export outer membrane protein
MEFFVTFQKNMQLFSSFFFTVKRAGLPLLTACISVLFMASCSTPKNTAYFKTITKDTSIAGFITNTYESKIQQKDVLGITVSSLSKELDEAFNDVSKSTMESGATGKSPMGYLVNEQGNILVHFLGSVHAEGLTRKELREKLQKDLLPYMKEPIVSVQYLNHKVTILGQVSKPQILNMPEEQMPLIDVLVSSGDLKENASRTNIMVIRENGTEKQVKYINLENHSLFTSPWYYVQPNDIVYVLPDNGKYAKEERRRTLQTTLSLIAAGASLLVIILNNLIK